MDRTVRYLLLLVFALAGIDAPTALPQTDKRYHLTSEKLSIQAEGPVAGLYAFGKHLYVVEGAQVVVLDVDDAKEVGRISGAPGINGLDMAFPVDRGFVSNSLNGNGSVTVFDISTMSIVDANIPIAKPSVVLVVAALINRVLAVGDQITAISAGDGKVLRTISLASSPGDAALLGTGSVLVTLPKRGSIAVIDAGLLRVTKEYKTTNCRSPRSVAVDQAKQHIFVGCESGMVSVYGLRDDKLVQLGPAVKLCKEIRGALMDDPEHLFTVLCDGGTLGFVQELSGDQLEYLPDAVTTAPSAAFLALASVGEARRILVGVPSTPVPGTPSDLSVGNHGTTFPFDILTLTRER